MILLARRALGKCLTSVQSTRVVSIQSPCRPVVAQRFNSTDHQPVRFILGDLKSTGLRDAPELVFEDAINSKIDWTKSFQGLSTEPFPKEVADILQSPVNPEDIEIEHEGLIYLPYTRYLEILNQAFGPGGWVLVPRGEPIITKRSVSREYALICHDRLVSIARGEKGGVRSESILTVTEDCKPSALTRCGKDLGIASELWDKRWVWKFKNQYCERIAHVDMRTEKKKVFWKKKGVSLEYPYKTSTPEPPTDPQTNIVRQVYIKSGVVPVDFKAVREAKERRELENP